MQRLREIEDNSIDAIFADPPYALKELPRAEVTGAAIINGEEQVTVLLDGDLHTIALRGN